MQILSSGQNDNIQIYLTNSLFMQGVVFSSLC